MEKLFEFPSQSGLLAFIENPSTIRAIPLLPEQSPAQREVQVTIGLEV